ncbi:protein kinase domain-containing protein [Melissococcus plutonius]|uniref:Lanthionine biosynthesis protein LanL n=2 Tax=Melissococcus plutonius TaxID=33970 RepID=A0A2Z5Y4L1_9ENTE|nr:lanthionine synthetase LanC family protein [Melissococcus plutonius]MCV2498942.1 protein kinase/lanthionine synthetase C family protein [Melissococcus plutonius]MCV2501406.1 protein kinase/lanthionine synthetase C family protein [Melissococcus plutonius]MCV2505390.1 protein kinase/lanthionine synthetase C family protein [Melissococcus plutonius]MCV2507783.1 protein kinase/lanthionine synthetase C family protein [Melissococcus plutonius]MCV2520167.1 protein kinase/lanthionine synthetase C fa
MAEDYDLCLDNPLFYVSSKSIPDVSKKFSVPLPEKWDEYRQNREWVALFPLNSKIQRQGWKVHISSKIDKSEDILNVVSDVCFSMNVTFKHLSSLEFFVKRNSKQIDRGVSGKFITCYPNEDDLEHFLNILEEKLEKFDGPYILSDKKWKNAPIYLRYGVFRDSNKEDGYSCDSQTLKINDKFIVDKRLPQFIVPEGLQIPNFLISWITEEDDSNDTDNYKMPFLIEKPIIFSNSGGIYRGSFNNIKVIVREARPYTGIENNGLDAVSRTKSEKLALDKLSNIEGVPICYWYGKLWDNYYLVTEECKGVALNHWLTQNYPLYDAQTSNNYLSRITSIIEQIIKIVEKAHATKIYHQDIHMKNILIDNQDNVSLIDWEQSVYNKKDKRRHLVAASGFRNWGYTTPANIDWYGVYQVANTLLYPAIVQSDLVYGYGKQTSKAGSKILEKFHYSKSEIDSYIRLLKTLSKKIGNIKVLSPSKVLHPYLEENDDTLENKKNRILNGLLEGFDSIYRRWEKEKRFFPVHYYGLNKNNGIAYSDLGVLWAYSKLIEQLDISKNSEYEELEKHLVSKAILNIEGNNINDTGLLDGISGTIWLLNKLKYTDEAARLYSKNYKKLISSSKNMRLYDGLCGILLVGINFSSNGLLTKEVSKDVFNEVEKFTLKYINHSETFIPITKDNKKSNDPYKINGGLLYGHAGLGWLFGEMYKLTSTDIYIKALNVSIENELKVYQEDKQGTLQYSQGDRVLPYLSMGSGGLGILICENYKLVDNEYKIILNKLYKAVDGSFCMFPGLFNGLSGLKVSQFFMNKYLGEINNDLILEDYIEELNGYLIKIGNGICIAGDGGMKITEDIASGFGGIVITLCCLIQNEFILLPKVKI